MTRRTVSPIFIGREAELERIEFLRAAAIQTGNGATVLVSGEAGVGKTRFAAEIASRVQAAGWTVLMGACDEFSAQARPFAALQEMSGAIREALERVLPSELDRASWQTIAQLSMGPAMEGTLSLAAGSVAQLVLDLFQRMARVRPLAVVIDDLHWADESTRQLFVTLARGLQTVPALLVGCYRGNEVDRGHPLRPVLAAIHRNDRPEQIDLEPFDREETSALARAVNGSRPNHGADFDGLFRRSGGNAFLLEELLATPTGVLPHGVAEVVLARIDALGADAVAVAEAASLDSSLPLIVLTAVCDLPANRVETALDVLAERSLLGVESGSSAFRHALIREVIYARIPPVHRTSLHGRAAEAFQQFVAHRTGEAARHWHLAGDSAQAFAASLTAAQAASRVGAFPEAADHYERALALWDIVPSPEEAAGGTHAFVVAYAATAITVAGRYRRSSALVEGALKREGCSAQERATLFLRLGVANRQAADWDDWNKSLPAFRRAVECIDASFTPTKRIEVLCNFGIEATANYGLDSEALAALKEADALSEFATAPADKHGLARLRSAVAVVHGHATARQTSAEARRITAENLQVLVGPRHAMLLGAHLWNAFEGVARSDRVFEAGFGAVTGIQAEWMIARSLSRLGRWREGLERLVKLAGRVGDEALVQTPDMVACGWGSMMARTGRVSHARRWLEIAAPLTLPAVIPHSMGYAVVCVELARLERDRDAARLAVNRIIDDAQGHFIALSAEAVVFAIALEADVSFARRGGEQETLDLVDHWLARLESCLVEAPGRVRIDDFGVFLEQCRAERSRLAGHDASETWEWLAEVWSELPRPYFAAYCRLRAAAALLLAGAPAAKDARERAARHLDIALATCRWMGAIHLEADIEKLRKVAGFRDSRPRAVKSIPTPPSAALPTLTARESQVLALLARGESNGRIGIALGISVRTAGVHVSNILQKLGASNRFEAAVRAGDLGIVERRP